MAEDLADGRTLRERAIDHVRSLARDMEYEAHEREAAKCATVVARRGDDEADDLHNESMLAVLLRRRAMFDAIPVVADGASFVAIGDDPNLQPQVRVPSISLVSFPPLPPASCQPEHTVAGHDDDHGSR